MRPLLFTALLASGTIALTNIVFGRQRWLNIAAFVLVCIAVAAGGSQVVVTNSNTGDHPYLGLDWISSSTCWPPAPCSSSSKSCSRCIRANRCSAANGEVDEHFLFNHLSVGAVLLCINFFVHRLFSWAAYEPLQQAIQSLPYLAELFLAVLVARPGAQYAAHRVPPSAVPVAHPRRPPRARARLAGGLAPTRIIKLPTIAQVAVLGVLFALGFSKPVLDAYIVVVGFQAVLIHSNVKLPWGWLRYVIVTPTSVTGTIRPTPRRSTRTTRRICRSSTTCSARRCAARASACRKTTASSTSIATGTFLAQQAYLPQEVEAGRGRYITFTRAADELDRSVGAAYRRAGGGLKCQFK